ncbi:MAG: F0F1 ATP synthase subunit A [Verrucomicrobiae bacterium]|nr:F0F1 ATP synthase subunit A [Verrucomicrobiae bacterium]
MDLGITHEVVLLWIAAATTLVVMTAGARLIAANLATTGRFANLVEALVEFVRSNIVEEFLGEHAKKWFGFFAALFFFLLFANLLGKLPGPVFRGVEEPRFWLESPTANINVTAGMAIFVFVVAQVAGIIKLGPVGYFKKKFLLPSAPWWVQPVALVIMPIVLLAEPFSLAVRLFANMTAGHKVLVTFAVAELVGGVWLLQQGGLWAVLAALPFALSVILLAFELFVAFIQAFIFTLLSALYISESLEEHH